MDENKKTKLVEIGYKIHRVCGICKHCDPKIQCNQYIEDEIKIDQDTEQYIIDKGW